MLARFVKSGRAVQLQSGEIIPDTDKRYLPIAGSLVNDFETFSEEEIVNAGLTASVDQSPMEALAKIKKAAAEGADLGELNAQLRRNSRKY